MKRDAIWFVLALVLAAATALDGFVAGDVYEYHKECNSMTKHCCALPNGNYRENLLIAPKS